MPVEVGVTNRLGVRMLMQPAVSGEWPGSPSGNAPGRIDGRAVGDGERRERSAAEGA
jgi:hypothetical protein